MAELVFFIEASLISFLLTGAMLRFSLKRRLLDVPNDRSSHSIPKPRLGGIAITIAFFVTCGTVLAAGFSPLTPPAVLRGMLVGGAVIALVGLWDDLRGIDAWVKLLAQCGAAAIPIVSGLVLETVRLPLIGSLGLGPLAVPFTLVWIVAIINFYNFIDGIDGLAAGIGMIASAFLALIAGMTGAGGIRSLSIIMAGASFGFLRYNFPPARIFMGDMGSTFLGYLFAVLSIAGEKQGIPAFITILLLSGVIGDAVLTLVRRALGRKKLFTPHRTHYYQRLTSLGLSHKQVTLLEYLVAILLGVSAILAFHREWTFVTFLSVVWIGFFMWALAKIRSMEKGERLRWERRTLAVAFGDVAFIALSYILSYYVRLNFRFPAAETSSMLISLPIVLVIRTAVFFYYGLYRRVWRYTTFDDIVRIAKAVSIGSAIMVVSFTLLFRFQAFPRSVFIIDWFVLIVFMAGSRIATRWFHELPAREEIVGKRVIIAGTGSMAELILQRVKKAGGLRPIGSLDDRTEMAGRVVHGLTVLGPFADIEELAARHRADEIIVVGAFADRIPLQTRERLARDGVGVRFVFDPAEIAAAPVGRVAEAPCPDRIVLVAGNGALVDAAGDVFARSAGLVLVSDDGRALGERGRAVPEEPARRHCYLGILHDRAALRGVLERHRPDVVFADFVLPHIGLGNPVEACVRTVLEPLEMLGAEVLRRPESRLFVIERRMDGREEFACARRASENVLRDMFRREPRRLGIVRLEAAPTLGGLRELVASLVNVPGGLYAAVPAGDPSEGRVSVEAIEAAPAPEVGDRSMRLSRCLADGDARGLEKTLREIADAVGEHVSEPS
jgi:UDP-GlcNAc:undecaprenyl-phosphate GlcNAc-1-phosphate transferase